MWDARPDRSGAPAKRIIDGLWARLDARRLARPRRSEPRRHVHPWGPERNTAIGSLDIFPRDSGVSRGRPVMVSLGLTY